MTTVNVCLAVVIVSFILTSCGDEGHIIKETGMDETGQAIFTIQMAPQLADGLVKKVTVIVKANQTDSTELVRQDLVIQGSFATGVIDVPAGKGLHFVVELRGENDTLITTGEKSADVIAGQPLELKINVTIPKTGKVNVVVTWEEPDGTILLYNFELDTEGWELGGCPADKELIHSIEMASHEKGALKLEGAFTGNRWEDACAKVLEGGADWTAYKTIFVDIYVPQDAKNFIAQLYLKTGKDWKWANTPDIDLKPGQWNQAVADLIQMGDLKDVREFGIKIGTGETKFEGAFYIDNVTVQ